MGYNVFDAAKDLIQGELEYAEESVQSQRLDTCNQCEVKSAGICTACGCVVQLKVKLLKSECPLGMW